MNRIALFLLLVTVAAAQPDEPKFFPAEFAADHRVPSNIRFYCSQGYTRDECARDVGELRKALAGYPVQRLGEWSFYLVHQLEWKALARSRGGPAVSPAFTLLLARATVLDRSLFSESVERNLELEKWSGMPTGSAFAAFALTHELGHALCHEKNEWLANAYGRELREGKIPHCPEQTRSTEPSIAQSDSIISQAAGEDAGTR